MVILEINVSSLNPQAGTKHLCNAVLEGLPPERKEVIGISTFVRLRASQCFVHGNAGKRLL